MSDRTSLESSVHNLPYVIICSLDITGLTVRLPLYRALTNLLQQPHFYEPTLRCSVCISLRDLQQIVSTFVTARRTKLELDVQ